MEAKPRHVRLRQALALLAGAVTLELLVGRGALAFFWTPLIVGVTYLAAALAGGRTGGHWATACVLIGWGVAVLWVGEARPELDTSGVYLVGAGLGAAAGVALARAGFVVASAGLAATVAGAGILLALSPRVSALDEGRTFALALGVVALVNLALALRYRPPAAA